MSPQPYPESVLARIHYCPKCQAAFGWHFGDRPRAVAPCIDCGTRSPQATREVALAALAELDDAAPK
jgi:hypothetical protein